MKTNISAGIGSVHRFLKDRFLGCEELLIGLVQKEPIGWNLVELHFEVAVTERKRCAWAESDPLMRAYHDEEWGVPEYDSRMLWETLMLEGFQAGLSWQIILRKREAFREAFAQFQPDTVARFSEKDVARLLLNPGIIRSRAKIEATICGASIYLKMRDAGEDFSRYVWTFVGGEQIQNVSGVVPSRSEISEKLSSDLKKRGFKFVGPVIVYAWMQATGIVNDHNTTCFRRELGDKDTTSKRRESPREAVII
jgi:DNA-3-methyladenine glycosylase I